MFRFELILREELRSNDIFFLVDGDAPHNLFFYVQAVDFQEKNKKENVNGSLRLVDSLCPFHFFEL